MILSKKPHLELTLIALAASLPLTAHAGAAASPKVAPKAPAAATTPARVKPKPLSANVKRGLDWLVEHQLASGGWGQGEESRSMGRGRGHANRANVADTCIATLALIRAGSTPKKGPHRASIRRALDYVLAEIEASGDRDMFVTKVRGTRVQGKLGPYIDTFLSGQLLAEVKNDMPDEASELKVLAALDKVLTKIRRNQKSNGSWGGGGWAPVLSEAVAGKAVNRASQAGVAVDEELLERIETRAKSNFDDDKGSFKADGSAGVGLYAGAASVGQMRDSLNTSSREVAELKKKARGAKTPEARAKAQTRLDQIEDTRRVQRAAESNLMGKLQDPAFRSGFGSNGGEEFLSYMLVSESLVSEGGDKWTRWDQAMATNLSRVQNRDGSWTGHHCITGRTFVTASALLVLTADRAPTPLAAKIRR